ncbi:MAG: hypothetical protein HKN07_06010 [Acidimicrobiia bacterium]|nr:hypothetical protein [Acidimicrobiia bacterium]
MRNVILWLHIGAAGTWLGANMFQLVGGPLVRKAGAATESAWLRAVVDLSKRLYPPAAILALLTGIELVRRGAWSYGDVFVMIGITMVVFGAVVGSALIGPWSTRLIEAIDTGGESASLRNRLNGITILETALVLFTIYAMVAKLGA